MRVRVAIAVQAALVFSASLVHATAPATQPTPPAWMAKKPEAWPQLLLMNRITDAQSRSGLSGSAGLVRLPNGVIVVMTAGHLLGEVKPGDFPKAFKSWVAVAPPGTGGVRMKSVAMDPSKPLDLDAVVLMPVSQSSSWPAAVLPIRQEPLEVGETVYLIAIPAAKGERQHVRKGQVLQVGDDHQVTYRVEGKFVTTGNSGAPVIDVFGRFAGVNTAHLDNQDDPDAMKLVLADASALMAEIVMPPGMKALPLPAPTTAPAAGSVAGTNADAETEAQKQLLIAQFMLDHGDATAATLTLRLILQDHPNTAAAKQAKAMLAKMPH